jgi:DNA invertase Pin-like site-specific DNA recombinase
MAVYGYARVSSISQSNQIQLERLKDAGCTVIRQEKISGRSRDGRSELETLMDFISEGDVLTVVKLDRLGRSTRDVLNLVHELDQQGASLRVLEPHIDTSTPEGRIILTTLSMVAEMELSFIKERQRAGIEKAKAKGLYKGRPKTVDDAEVKRLKAEGLGATAIAKKMGIGRATVYKCLAKA